MENSDNDLQEVKQTDKMEGLEKILSGIVVKNTEKMLSDAVIKAKKFDGNIIKVKSKYKKQLLSYGPKLRIKKGEHAKLYDEESKYVSDIISASLNNQIINRSHAGEMTVIFLIIDALKMNLQEIIDKTRHIEDPDLINSTHIFTINTIRRVEGVLLNNIENPMSLNSFITTLVSGGKKNDNR